MIRILLVALLFIFSCSDKPSARDIEKSLDARYRFFGDVEDVRILSMVKLDEKTYFAQIKYGVRFKKDIDEIEKEVSDALRDADIYKNLSLFVNIVALNELVSKCGRAYVEKGRVCYITESVKIVNVKGSWIVQRM